MSRNFNEWFSTFRSSISDYGYYVDFEKAYRNVEEVKVELNILNSLVGSKNIEEDFTKLVREYPNILRCIPILLAVRSYEIEAIDADGEFLYCFNHPNLDIKQYAVFMRKTGLFKLISEKIISNLYDYVTGVEVGLDSNARKSRGGKLMEDKVEKYIKKAGFTKGESYFKEMNLSEISKKWSIDLTPISNGGKVEKRFDFVIKTDAQIYLIETNFYASSGSKLNETARSYKTIALECKDIPGVSFVWFTDGKGWVSARNNLEETFDLLETIYNINDLEGGAIEKMVGSHGQN